ncbi:MAG TPA: hypothetical protein VF435_16870 [Pyrinomonadaceae bacterium]
MSRSVKTVSPVRSEDVTAREIDPRLPKQFTGQRFVVLFFMIMIFAAAARPISDPDFWWHLRTGQYITETKAIPYIDIFSWLRFGSEWVTHEWLSEVLMYLVFRAAGFAGLIIFFALVITMAFWTTYRLCLERTGHAYIAGLVTILCAAATMPTWGVRPQMFSILFAGIFLVVLDKYCRNQKTRLVWWLIPLMVLWVNMHAGFAAGIALIGVTVVGLALDARIRHKDSVSSIFLRIRRLCLVGVLAGTAVLLNPNGLRIYSYPFETLRSQAQMRYIQEWKSPNFQDPTFLALLILIVLIFCVLALSNKRPRPSEMLILIATLAATMRSARNVPFFALVAAPTFADHLWSWFSAQRKSSQKSGGLAPVLSVVVFVILPVIVAVMSVQRAVARQPQVEAENFPVAAVEFIKSHEIPQPIYNEYHWGGYLIWKLYPQYRVFIDGRADVYGDALIEEYFTVHDGESSWKTPIDKYKIQSVLVEPNTAIASLLRQDPTWQKVFEDQQAVIFTHTLIVD